MTAVEVRDHQARLLDRYQRDTDLPLMVLAISVIPLVLVEFLVDVEPRAERGLELTYNLIWLAFLADYMIRLVLAPDKRAYVKSEWLALLLVVLTFPLPRVSNPLEILRSARALRLLRLFRIGAVTARGAQRVVKLPRGANSQLAVGLATFIMLGLVASVLALAIEEGRSGSQINTMGDALWWAVATVTTIGYGDVVPQTAGGRVLAFALMLAGVGLVGVVVANLASRVMSGIERRIGDAALTHEEIVLQEIATTLDELNQRLARLENPGSN